MNISVSVQANVEHGKPSGTAGQRGSDRLFLLGPRLRPQSRSQPRLSRHLADGRPMGL